MAADDPETSSAVEHPETALAEDAPDHSESTLPVLGIPPEWAALRREFAEFLRAKEAHPLGRALLALFDVILVADVNSDYDLELAKNQRNLLLLLGRLGRDLKEFALGDTESESEVLHLIRSFTSGISTTPTVAVAPKTARDDTNDTAKIPHDFYGGTDRTQQPAVLEESPETEYGSAESNVGGNEPHRTIEPEIPGVNHLASNSNRKYYYHATAAEHLNDIAEHGLRTSDQAMEKGLIKDTNWGGYLGDESFGRMFFAPTSRDAMYYGEIVFRQQLNNYGRASIPVCLRVRMPAKTEVVRQSSEYFVENATVPPQDIDVWWQRDWQPLHKGIWNEFFVERNDDGDYFDWEGALLGSTYDDVVADLKSFAYPKKDGTKRAMLEHGEEDTK